MTRKTSTPAHLVLIILITLFLVAVPVATLAQGLATLGPAGAPQDMSNGEAQPNSASSIVGFGRVSWFGVQGASTFVTAADVNGDGLPDLLVSESPSNSIALLINGGSNKYHLFHTPFPSGGASPGTIVPIDLNRDGKIDLVVANQSQCSGCVTDGVIAVFMGNGNGTFASPVLYDSGGLGLGSQDLAVVDVNGDGKPDIIVLNCGPGNASSCGSDNGVLSVLLGNGDGTFQPAKSQDVGLPVNAGFALADVNGDGKPDVLISSPTCSPAGNCPTASLIVMLGEGDGTFESAASYSTGAVLGGAIAVGDLNHDGKPDVVVGGCAASPCASANGVVSVLLGNGDGSFQPPVLYDIGGPYSLAITDLNFDGNSDVLVSDVFGRSVDILLGNGDGSFQFPPAILSQRWPPVSVAVFDGGDIAFATGAGVVGALVNNTLSLQPTSTSLTSKLNPSIYGEALTLTATISHSSGSPGGYVTFYDGTTNVGTRAAGGGVSKITIRQALPAGSHSFMAAYQGSPVFGRSTSPPMIQTIEMATSSTTLTSSLNPASTGQSVTFMATITSRHHGAATGSVTFYSGSQALGTVALSGGVATLTTAFSSAGTFSITAQYAGDSNNIASASPILDQTINQATSAALISQIGASDPKSANQPRPNLSEECGSVVQAWAAGDGINLDGVTFNASVDMSLYCRGQLGYCTGQVIFSEYGSTIATANVNSSCSATTSTQLPAGNHRIKALFNPNIGHWRPSSSWFTYQVSKYPTSTTLTSSQDPTTQGQPVTLTAIVSAATGVPPTGKVRFTIGIKPVALVTLSPDNNDGVAVAALPDHNLQVGTHVISAQYYGDSVYAPSSAPVLVQIVNSPSSAAQAREGK